MARRKVVGHHQQQIGTIATRRCLLHWRGHIAHSLSTARAARRVAPPAASRGSAALRLAASNLASWENAWNIAPLASADDAGHS